MCSGLLRVLEGFSNQAAWNDPDRYWLAVLTLVNWVGNVLLPVYGALQVVLSVVHFSGLMERMTIGEAWGAEPCYRDVLFRSVGFAAAGGVLDAKRDSRGALARRSKMPLNVTPVNRNLQTRVTFMFLEFEDLFVVLGIAAMTNVVGHFVGRDRWFAHEHRRAVRRAAVHHSVADVVQVRKATRVHPRSLLSGT